MSAVCFGDRYSKRKRQAISYAEPSDDEGLSLEEEEADVKSEAKAKENVQQLSDAADSDEDSDYGTETKKKKKKRQMTESEKKFRDQRLLEKKRAAKPFPFMKLPPELRNMIYDTCLVAPKRVLHIKSYQNAYRRVAVHCAPSACKPQARGYWANRPVEVQGDPTAHKRYDLVPRLLAVSKTIYAEASGYFYNQEWVLADTYALQSLLLCIGPTGAAKLRNLTIATSHSHVRCQKSVTLAGFSLLRDATSLQKITIKADMDWYCSGGRYNTADLGEKSDAARAGLIGKKVYRDCWPWMQVLARKGGMQAIEDTVELGDPNIHPNVTTVEIVQSDGPVHGWTEQRDAMMRKMIAQEIFRLAQDRS